MKKKVFILIDGSNFYFKLKDLELNHIPFDFSSLAKLLAKNDKVVNAIYYVGAVKYDGTERTQKCSPTKDGF